MIYFLLENAANLLQTADEQKIFDAGHPRNMSLFLHRRPIPAVPTVTGISPRLSRDQEQVFACSFRGNAIACHSRFVGYTIGAQGGQPTPFPGGTFAHGTFARRDSLGLVDH